jgi:alkylated DNA repair dioxygenase AlkB
MAHEVPRANRYENFFIPPKQFEVKELFPITLKLPEGFSYHENFITPDDEQQLLTLIKGFELHPMIFQGFEARRKVASFGYDYSFDKKKLTKGKEIPAELEWLVAKVANYLSLPVRAFAELLITEYPVGSVINWHRDAPPFDIIAGISLSTNCIFKLRPHEKVRQTRKATISLPVERRSLYVMSGVARDEWQHSTAPVSEVRHSITLRTLKQ